MNITAFTDFTVAGNDAASADGTAVTDSCAGTNDNVGPDMCRSTDLDVLLNNRRWVYPRIRASAVVKQVCNPGIADIGFITEQTIYRAIFGGIRIQDDNSCPG